MTHRRNLDQALASAGLDVTAAAFVRGKAVQQTGSVGKVDRLPRGTAPDAPAAPSLPSSSEEGLIRGTVSVSFRLSAEMAARLLQAALSRKLRRQEPFTQQAILTAALEVWLKRQDKDF
jgi:hypothetical protein